MVLLFCDGVIYTAKELEFLVRIGWLPVEVLLGVFFSVANLTAL